MTSAARPFGSINAGGAPAPASSSAAPRTAVSLHMPALEGDAHAANDDDDDAVSEADSETVLNVPGKGFEPESGMKFKSLPVMWAIIVELLFVVVYCVLLYVDIDSIPIGGDDSLFLSSVLLHVILTVTVALITFYIEYFFRRIRYQGHLNFHRSSKTKRMIPLIVLSCGHAVILLLMCLWTPADAYLGLQRINVLQIVVTIEAIIISIDLFMLARLVYKFNKTKPPPDASEELVPGFEAVNVSQNDRIVHDLGFSEEDYLDDVMEKQGDMIKYLQQQKENLSLRIVQLTERLRRYEQENDQPTESDYQYLLKTKDNEMRVAIGERNQTIQRLESTIASLTSQQQQLLADKEQLAAALAGQA